MQTGKCFYWQCHDFFYHSDHCSVTYDSYVTNLPENHKTPFKDVLGLQSISYLNFFMNESMFSRFLLVVKIHAVVVLFLLNSQSRVKIMDSPPHPPSEEPTI